MRIIYQRHSFVTFVCGALLWAVSAQSRAAGYQVFVSNEKSGDLTVISGSSSQSGAAADGDFKIAATIPVGKRPRGIHASPDGKIIYVALSGTPIEPPPTLDANGNPIFQKSDDDDDSNAKSDKSADGIGLVDVAQKKFLRKIPAGEKARVTQLAWFGGVALFFITLIFPIQFSNQWITIGWALEGAALLWLFHRVPHPGLRLVGVGLLAAAFVRLTFNHAVFEYHPRATTPIFNWYLYAYGIATISLFAGSKLLAPPRNQVFKINAPPILAGLGTILAFLLLNIEIADYFSQPGSTLTFQFSGDFARDMTYSIAWALFALVLLVAGILKKIPAARYAAMALLCVTLVKLFFHDLVRLNQLYRVCALIGVALIAWLAAFAYQKFFSATAKPPEAKDETLQ